MDEQRTTGQQSEEQRPERAMENRRLSGLNRARRRGLRESLSLVKEAAHTTKAIAESTVAIGAVIAAIPTGGRSLNVARVAARAAIKDVTRAVREHRRRTKMREKRNREDGGMREKKQDIPLVEGALFAGFLFFLFDVPQMILALFIIGIFLNWIISLFGWLAVYIWLKRKGYSLLDINDIKKGYGSLLFLFSGMAGADVATLIAPCLALFVIIFVLKIKAERLLARVIGNKSAQKALYPTSSLAGPLMLNQNTKK